MNAVHKIGVYKDLSFQYPPIFRTLLDERLTNRFPKSCGDYLWLTVSNMLTQLFPTKDATSFSDQGG